MAWCDDFRGREVFVTGASSGIGRETALAFGGAGARPAASETGTGWVKSTKDLVNQELPDPKADCPHFWRLFNPGRMTW